MTLKKIYIFLIIIILFEIISCKKENLNKDSVSLIKEDWQENFGLTHNIDKDTIWYKPVRFYLENKNCSPIAKDFYFGKYRPTDEPKTAELLNLATTEDNHLRPFYRWILNKTIQIQDGALGEYTGLPARKYAEKFPKEFFEYMDYDKTGQKYIEWTSSIEYSGFDKNDDWKKPNTIREKIILKMSENCINCNEIYRNRILKFANDCFPDINFKNN